MVWTAYRSVAQVVVAALALAIAMPERAQAWTEAHVTHVSARLDASQPPNARVQLEIGVRVTGGWLSRFDVLGLDSGLVVAADAPPTLSAPDGRIYSATATTPEPGSLVLDFGDKHAAPRRGQYVIHVAYDTRAPYANATRMSPTSQSATRVSWSLPRWDVSLDDVSVTVLAPLGSKPAPDTGARTRVDALSVTDQGNATQLGFSRMALARTQSFDVAFDVPARARDGWSATTSTPLQPGARLPLWLGLALGLLALTKRALARAAAAREHLQLLALVPVPRELLRACLVLVLCVASGALQDITPLGSALLAVLGVMLTLARGFERSAVTHDASERAATVEDLEQTRGERVRELWGPAAWLDATTPVGLLVLCALHAPGLWLVASTGVVSMIASSCIASALLATPLFVTATRLTRPVGIGRVLHHLATLRGALKGLPARTELCVQLAADGRPCRAQLRLVLASIPAGMGKLELTVADANYYGRPRWTLCWLARCRADSSADMLLARALPDARRAASDHADCVSYQSITLDVVNDAHQLVGWLAHETAARRDAA